MTRRRLIDWINEAMGIDSRPHVAELVDGRIAATCVRCDLNAASGVDGGGAEVAIKLLVKAIDRVELERLAGVIQDARRQIIGLVGEA